MTTDAYLDGWTSVRDLFERAIADNETILKAQQSEVSQQRTRGILDAIRRAKTVVDADIDRQINPVQAMDQ